MEPTLTRRISMMEAYDMFRKQTDNSVMAINPNPCKGIVCDNEKCRLACGALKLQQKQ